MRAVILGLAGLVLAGVVYYALTLLAELRSPDRFLERTSRQYLKREGYEPRTVVGINRSWVEDTVTWFCEGNVKVSVVLKDKVPVSIKKEET